MNWNKRIASSPSLGKTAIPESILAGLLFALLVESRIAQSYTAQGDSQPRIPEGDFFVYQFRLLYWSFLVNGWLALWFDAQHTPVLFVDFGLAACILGVRGAIGIQSSAQACALGHCGDCCVPS